MKRIVISTLAFSMLFVFSSCKCRPHQSEVSLKAQELSVLLEDPAFTRIDGVKDIEVGYITQIKQIVDDASTRIVDVNSLIENKDIPTESGDFKIYVMQFIGLVSRIDGVKQPFKDHLQFLISLLSSESESSNTDYESIKRSLLQSDSVISVYTDFLTAQGDYQKAIESFTLVLTDVLLSLDSQDQSEAISKMTSPEVQDFLLASLDYLSNVLEFEKGRADDVLKAQSLNSRIN